MHSCFYRIDHSPIQRVREKLRPGGGNLLYEALDVLPLLLRVDAASFGSREFGPIESQTLIIVTVVQGNQLPFARLLVCFLLIKLVEDAVRCCKLLSLSRVELTGTVGRTCRKKQGFILADGKDAAVTGRLWLLPAIALTQLETEADLGPVFV